VLVLVLVLVTLTLTLAAALGMRLPELFELNFLLYAKATVTSLEKYGRGRLHCAMFPAVNWN
jgi:hypothetical protein